MNLKRHFATGLAVACLVLGAAIAQSITKSIQLSQDGSGPIGYDTQGNSYFPGHLNNSAGAPSLAGCGTSPSVTGTDTGGVITEGTGTLTACHLDFKTAFNATPFCVASTTNATTPIGVTATAGGINFLHLSSAAVATFNYICIGKT